jgi:hypothetical protein
MLKSIRITEDDDGDTYVEFYGDGESDEQSFWLCGLAPLERVARMCLDTRVRQMVQDGLEEVATRLQEETSTKKKAA